MESPPLATPCVKFINAEEVPLLMAPMLVNVMLPDVVFVVPKTPVTVDVALPMVNALEELLKPIPPVPVAPVLKLIEPDRTVCVPIIPTPESEAEPVVIAPLPVKLVPALMMIFPVMAVVKPKANANELEPVVTLPFNATEPPEELIVIAPVVPSVVKLFVVSACVLISLPAIN